MLSCRKAAVLLSQDVDGELAGFGQFRLRCHLLICSVCRNLRKQLIFQKKAVGLAGEETSPLSEELRLPNESRAKIKSLLQKQEKEPPV